ncbi:GlsB/YeaQ/YmgE family stress response membrane protein [Microvirga lotononidis]|nr:GlsB/YeaQ/YmgE family stress response membrane protein [Microvirga lotononidis]WQO31527.1 GlsB/YeaQ/YmgE family stress response membrane protein [Microvirga lotononidis]
MSIIGWLVLGLIAGFIASKIVNKSGEGVILDIVLGIVGAVVGGFIFNAIGHVGVTGFNLWSMVLAVIGVIVVLALYHAVAGRSGSSI